ncbi:MAG: replicative DNA helicase [Clostridia bacterium]|nr:replicative DNA helicase [Clostridia bacterium]MCR5695313.1 replicative DNA helicase [Clostridia bacterium]
MPENGNLAVPQSIESENALLGAMMSDNNVVTDIMDEVSALDFYSESNRFVFEACISLFNDGIKIDLLTVMERLEKKGNLDKIGGAGYLTGLAGGSYLVANAVAYAKIIAEKATMRRLISAGRSIVDAAYKGDKGLDGTVEFAENEILRVTQNTNTKGYRVLADVNQDVFMELEQNVGKNGMTGIPTGFRDLDAAMSGMKKADMIVVGARPGMGKTAFMLDIARYVGFKKKLPVAIFNLEMTKEQLATRILSAQSDVESEKLKRANLSTNDWNALAEAVYESRNVPIYIDDTTDASIQSIRAKCRKMKLENDIKLIIIDYMQLMTSAGRRGDGNRVVEVSDISRQIKLMARELEVPIIVGSQLSRDVEKRDDKRPKMSDLRESGGIEQDADVVLFLYREKVYNKDTNQPTVAEVIISKQRNGMTTTCKLHFDEAHVSFKNLSTHQ